VSEFAEETSACPLPLPTGDRVLLAHGSGGRLTNDLIRSLFLPAFGTLELDDLGDAAVVDVNGTRLAFTTDAFVVHPHFFPGSDIGTLAVNGTVNDLAMVGAQPLLLSCAFILEEGFALADLHTIATSMGDAARAAGVRIVTGDTKVVERGSGDGIFVVTSGIGIVHAGRNIAPHNAQVGDAVIVSGPVAAHGVAVMSRRAGIAFSTDVRSDTAPLTQLVDAMAAAGPINCLRDATRGGLATALNELADASQVRITIDQQQVPVDDAVLSACELLGLDPLYVANEGVCVAIIPHDARAAVLDAMADHPLGRFAALIGVVEHGAPGVHLRTSLGTTRPLLTLSGDQLPRIC
jgi:hydrogenase expression/formation protein HypE